MKSLEAKIAGFDYFESGPPDGFSVLMLHDFTDDAPAWEEVAGQPAAVAREILSHPCRRSLLPDDGSPAITRCGPKRSLLRWGWPEN